MSLQDGVEGLAARVAQEINALRNEMINSGNGTINNMEFYDSADAIPTGRPAGTIFVVPVTDPAADFNNFVPGITEPYYTQTADFDAASRNVGVDPSVTLTPYTGTFTSGLSQVNDGALYENMIIDGGILEIRSAATFRNCRFILPDSYTAADGTQALIRILNGASATGMVFENCEFHNRCQRPFNAVSGRNATFRRCVFSGWVDAFSESVGGSAPQTRSFIIEDCVVPSLAWWYSPSLGDVHGSDTSCHADGIQKSTSTLHLDVSNTLLLNYVDEFIGTGTPGSGRDAGGTFTDTGATTDYTANQAQMEGWRNTYANVFTTPSQSYGGVSHRNTTQGTHAGLMLNAENISLDKVVFGGGIIPVNAVDSVLATSMNVHMTNCTFYNDMKNGPGSRSTNPAVKGYAILITSGKSFQTFTGNLWADGTAVAYTGL